MQETCKNTGHSVRGGLKGKATAGDGGPQTRGSDNSAASRLRLKRRQEKAGGTEWKGQLYLQASTTADSLRVGMVFRSRKPTSRQHKRAFGQHSATYHSDVSSCTEDVSLGPIATTSYKRALRRLKRCEDFVRLPFKKHRHHLKREASHSYPSIV